MAVTNWNKLASTSGGEVILAASPVDAGITGWDLASGAECVHLRTCATPHHGLALLGKHHVAALQTQKNSSASNGCISYWAWNKPQPEIRSFPVEPIIPVVCNSDGTYLAGGGRSGRIYLWEVATGHLLRVWSAHFKALTRLIFSDDESLLLSGAEDGFIKAWTLMDVLDTQKTSELSSLESFSGHSLAVTDIVTGYGGCSAIVVSSSLDFTCKIWSLALGSLLRMIKFPTPVNTVALDPGEYALYAGCTDGRIYVSSLNGVTTGGSTHGADITATLVDHSGAITALAFSTDGILLVSGSADCTVRVWDTISCQVLRVFKHSSGPISNLIVMPFSTDIINTVNQSSIVNKRGSVLVPVPLNKFTVTREGNNGHEPTTPCVFLSLQESDDSNLRTSVSMKQQIKELQQQNSSAAVQMQMEKVKSDYDRSLQIIQQWQHVYQDLHSFCATELIDENKPEDRENIEKSKEKGKRGRGKAVGGK